ncbi:MAG: YbaK/EbsC family protein [Spirochaetales bacterium]|nr:YbaK/EbsC family protein [Spirochaetales bacterium]
MSVERVRAFLKPFNLEDRIQTFDVSSATVALAAQAVGVQEAQILKTLSFRKKDGTVLLVCAAGDAKIENKLFKAEFATKAKMLSAQELLDEVGYAIGGVCPFVKADHIEITLDRSLLRFDAIYPAGGDAASAVKLSCEELETVTGGRWVQVCSLIE